MKNLYPPAVLILCCVGLFASLHSSPQQVRALSGGNSPLGLAWNDAVSGTVLVPQGTPVLIVEAPSNESIVLRQVWGPDNDSIHIQVEESSSGLTLPLLNGFQTWAGLFYTGPSSEMSGWRGVYVLNPGDKLWATNTPGWSSGGDEYMHWTGFYLP